MMTPKSKYFFSNYLVKFNKNYGVGSDEFNTRLQYFKDTVVDIQRRNAKNTTATFGLNVFSDWSPLEKSKLVMKPQAAPLMGISCLANGVTVEKSGLSVPTDPPTAWDWRQKNMVSPVKNQGGCGSCWTFSTTGAIESAYAIKYGTLLNLSEQEIVDCSTACDNEPPYGLVCDGGCGGGWPWLAMTDLMSWKGMATEDQYPYTGGSQACQRLPSMDSAPITNYTCLSGTGQQGGGVADEGVMAAFLFANGPLSIALNANPLFSYTGGVVQESAAECTPLQLDHAILIVGYGTYNGVPMWIVKNSWGASWGLNGYFYLYRGSNTCGVAAAVSFPIVR